MVLNQMVLVIETDSGTDSNTFLTKPSLLRRTGKKTIKEDQSCRNPLFRKSTSPHVPKSGMPSLLYFPVHISKVLSVQENLTQECEMFFFVLCSAQWKSTHSLAESSLNVIHSHKQQITSKQRTDKTEIWNQQADVKRHKAAHKPRLVTASSICIALTDVSLGKLTAVIP